MPKSRTVSLVGIVAAVAFVILFLLSQVQARMRLTTELARAKEALGRRETVLVPKAKIEPGTYLSADFLAQNVRERSLLAAELPPGYVTSREALLGRVTRETLYPDEPILDGRIAPAGTAPSVRAGIREGRVAFALPVSAERAVGGQVRSQDRIDVIAADESGARVLLRDVLVLGRPVDFGVAQQTQEAEPGFALPGSLPGGSGGTSSILILDLAPDEALALAQAYSRASVYVALRGAPPATNARP